MIRSENTLTHTHMEHKRSGRNIVFEPFHFLLRREEEHTRTNKQEKKSNKKKQMRRGKIELGKEF